MALRIIAIVCSFLLSFLVYVYMWAARESRDKNKHPILFLIIEYLFFFLAVAWIVIFCGFLFGLF